jgi:methanogenic corrinoid protein MtbC1
VTTVQLGPTSLVLDLLASTRALDARRIRERLDSTARALGLDRAVDEVLLPALRLIGAQWAGGTVDVAAEHLLSTVTSSWLAGLHAAQPEPSYDRPVLLACGPRDLHSLGLECMAALLGARGVDCRNLGARTPTASVIAAVGMIRPAAVVVVSHSRAGTASAADRTVRAVSALGVDVYYAGFSFTSEQARRGLPGTYLGLRISAAADQVVAGSLR